MRMALTPGCHPHYHHCNHRQLYHIQNQIQSVGNKTQNSITNLKLNYVNQYKTTTILNAIATQPLLNVLLTYNKLTQHYVK
jgi:hypothetical protein